MSAFELAAAARDLEIARLRWEKTEADADYIAFLEAEGRWQRCRIAELAAAVKPCGRNVRARA